MGIQPEVVSASISDLRLSPSTPEPRLQSGTFQRFRLHFCGASLCMSTRVRLWTQESSFPPRVNIRSSFCGSNCPKAGQQMPLQARSRVLWTRAPRFLSTSFLSATTCSRFALSSCPTLGPQLLWGGSDSRSPNPGAGLSLAPGTFCECGVPVLVTPSPGEKSPARLQLESHWTQSSSGR